MLMTNIQAVKLTFNDHIRFGNVWKKFMETIFADM